jgi:phytoene dehydrogenase-like protein
MTSTTTVVIVGGGPAGLVAARHLAAAGIDVRLVERESAFGGRVRSRHEDGFTFDRGFQVLLTAYPSVQRELDLEALDLRSFAPGAVLARAGSRSTLSDPFRDRTALLSTLFNGEITFGDKLELVKLKRRLADVSEAEAFSGTDCSIREYLRTRGFSEDFIAHFAAPFYGGITLDRSLSTSSNVFEYTFACFANGSAALPASGMGAIPEQLAERARDAGAVLVPNATVSDVTADDQGARVTLESGETHEPDAVLVATDPKSARSLTGVESIPTIPRGCVTLFYSLPGDRSLDAGKRIILNVEDGEPNQVVPLSAVVPEYAPDDRTLLAATFLGDRDEHTARLDDAVQRTIESWYPDRTFPDLELLGQEELPFAQFDQPPGIHDGLPDVDDPEGRCYLAGEYTRWSSIHGALESGKEAAERITAGLV